jgi:putative membrane protein
MASQMTVQLNSLVASYGSMETIHLTPLPVTYLIHLKQVLALFIGVLPFALVEEMGWYTVLMVSLVCFTLYGWFSHNTDGNNPFGANLLSGIDAIGAQVCKLWSIKIDPGLRTYFRLRGFANI